MGSFPLPSSLSLNRVPSSSGSFHRKNSNPSSSAQFCHAFPDDPMKRQRRRCSFGSLEVMVGAAGAGVTNPVPQRSEAYTVGDFMTKKENVHIVKTTTSVDKGFSGLETVNACMIAPSIDVPRFSSLANKTAVNSDLPTPTLLKLPRDYLRSRSQHMSISSCHKDGGLHDPPRLGRKDCVIIVDHGSRRQESNLMLNEFVTMFQKKTGYAIVEPAHMELAEPSIKDAFDLCVSKGATHVIVSPFFLFPGRHWCKDIPSLTAEAASRHPGVSYIVTAPLGRHELLVDVVNDRITRCLSHVAGDANECEVCAGTGRCRVYQSTAAPTASTKVKFRTS